MAGLLFAPLCHLQPKNYSNILRLFIISTTRNPVQTPRPPGSKAEWKDSPNPQSLQPKHIPWKKYCSWMSINKLTCLSVCKSHVLKRKSHPQMVCVLLPATLLHVSGGILHRHQCNWELNQLCCQRVLYTCGTARKYQKCRIWPNFFAYLCSSDLSFSEVAMDIWWINIKFSSLCTNHSFFISFCQFSRRSILHVCIITADSKSVGLVWCL